jgi:cytochrome c peroxidase
MASSRLELAHFIGNDALLRPAYEGVFGTLPDMAGWPSAGKPGDPAFDVLPADAQGQVNRLAANVGKSLEAYMRKNTSGAAPLDAYLGGDASQLTDEAIRGLEVFIDHGCASCHGGSMLTDEKFHDVGFPSLPGAMPDPGRSGGASILQNDIFNLAGPYADPGTGAVPPVIEPHPLQGAFRTPSLRNVVRTPPYGHDGALATLDDVLAVHAPDMNAADRGAVVAFFQTLNGSLPALPWSNWPSPQ